MSERASDRWLPWLFSATTHLAIAAALAWGYWHYKAPPPKPQQLAIEATVVDAASLPAGALPAATPAPAPAPADTTPVAEPPPAEVPPAPVPAPTPPPKADPPARAPAESPNDVEQRRQAQLERQAARAKAQTAAKAEATLKAARDKAAADAKVEQQRLAAERKSREEAERKLREDAERVQRDKAEADRQKAAREAELRTRMAAEEHLVAAQASGMLAQYQAQIRARIERAWIRPTSAKPGLSCEVRITQIPGGEVVGVKVGNCNGDDTVRQSIEAAAYRASPLPLPPDPALFDRNLVVTFKPQD
jgi:colicin import membrane protein